MNPTTYATRLLDRGFNIREVQTLLGHANVQTTQVYTHVNPEELQAELPAQWTRRCRRWRRRWRI